ncbi:MAG TPA: rod shape-determining protein MreC [Acidimicrobiales bacterium]|nr:rod shape-determining protein MreC [Acidimicrobiales bacterium]
MPRSRRFGRSRFTLILLVLASLTVLTLDYRDSGPVQGARNALGTVLSPFRSVGEWVATPFQNGWEGITGYDDLKDENTDLRRQLDEVRGDEVEADALTKENEELRRLNDLPVTADIPRTTAEITSGPLTSFDTTLEIDKGSGDGIKVGMAVITEAGLVGRIHRVQGGRARVQLITDPDFPGVGVRLVESGDVGLARGSSRGRLRVEEGITATTPVERGEDLVTSGLERSNYPAGIPVGTVIDVQPTEDQVEQALNVEPAADLDAVRFVIVLLCDENCG